MTRLNSRRSFVTTAVIGMLLGQQVKAQEINYGALSYMFGEPVSTSAIGSPQKASQVPADMPIITSEEIPRSGTVTIPDILRNYAGIDVRQNGALGPEVSFRGIKQ